MTVSQTRSARKKMVTRYGEARKHRSVAAAIEEERKRAARALASSRKKK